MSDTVSTVSAFRLFTLSKEVVKRNINTFVILVIIPSLILLVSEVIDFANGSNNTPVTLSEINPASLVFTIGGLLLAFLFAPAVAVSALRASSGGEITAKQALKESWPIFFKYYILSILLGIVVTIGLLLLIVPGVIALQRFFLAPYFLVDQRLGVIESMKQSAKVSKGKFLAIYGILGVTILLSLPSIVPLAGTFVAVVLTMLYICAPALRYYELAKAKNLEATPNEVEVLR